MKDLSVTDKYGVHVRRMSGKSGKVIPLVMVTMKKTEAAKAIFNLNLDMPPSRHC